MNPPRPDTPPNEPPVVVEFIATEEIEDSQPAVLGLPPSLAPQASFRFVQDDELEVEAQAEAAEEAEAQSGWQEQLDQVTPEVEVSENITELTVNGHTIVQDTITITTTAEVSIH